MRWHRDTLAEWFRQAAGIAAPKAKRRASPAVERGAGPRERFDWWTVEGLSSSAWQLREEGA